MQLVLICLQNYHLLKNVRWKKFQNRWNFLQFNHYLLKEKIFECFCFLVIFRATFVFIKCCHYEVNPESWTD